LELIKIHLILHIAQLVPEYPGAQLHVYDVPVTWHVAAFKQGFEEQGFESFFIKFFFSFKIIFIFFF
jgi:hypothetical protein